MNWSSLTMGTSGMGLSLTMGTGPSGLSLTMGTGASGLSLTRTMGTSGLTRTTGWTTWASLTMSCLSKASLYLVARQKRIVETSFAWLSINKFKRI